MPIPNCDWYAQPFYHVISHGAQQLPLFLEEKDYEMFLSVLDDTLHYSPFTLHAYCLMKNHYHILIGTASQPLSKIMKEINEKYALWLRNKYDLKGQVIKNQYSSLLITSDYDFMITSAFIHNEPRTIGHHPINYSWSSYHHYIFPTELEDNRTQVIKVYRGIDGNVLFNLYANPSHCCSFIHESSSPHAPPMALTKEHHQRLFPSPLYLHYEKFVEKEWKLRQILKEN